MTDDDAWREALQVGFIHTAGGRGRRCRLVRGGGTAAGAAAGAQAMTLTQPPLPAVAPGQAAALTPQALAQAPTASPMFDAQILATLPIAQATFSGDAGDDAFYLILYPSYRFFDGRLANRPWLQELPDPVSKFSWSSWVEINPATAQRLGLDIGHIVEVETERGSVTVPVWWHPGIRQDTIAIQLGQGHQHLGRYAKERGVNPLELLDAAAEPLSGGTDIRADARPHPANRQVGAAHHAGPAGPGRP
jgi:anaerobic selenocysteine-containing dehydrogenase